MLWRDSGDWDAFAGVWHPDGMMNATWQQSRADAFIAACRIAWDQQVDVLHLLGGSTIDVAGTRAVTQTKTTISQRGVIDDQLVDVTCIGHFYDLFDRR